MQDLDRLHQTLQAKLHATQPGHPQTSATSRPDDHSRGEHTPHMTARRNPREVREGCDGDIRKESITTEARIKTITTTSVGPGFETNAGTSHGVPPPSHPSPSRSPSSPSRSPLSPSDISPPSGQPSLSISPSLLCSHPSPSRSPSLPSNNPPPSGHPSSSGSSPSRSLTLSDNLPSTSPSSSPSSNNSPSNHPPPRSPSALSDIPSPSNHPPPTAHSSPSSSSSPINDSNMDKNSFPQSPSHQTAHHDSSPEDDCARLSVAATYSSRYIAPKLVCF